jgi:regulator of protease activity HflC (stomatin/prohibitin superfamily)
MGLPGTLCIQRARARVQKMSEGMDAATMGVRRKRKEREAKGEREASQLPAKGELESSELPAEGQREASGLPA